MGHKKAMVALAHRILIIISHLLKEQQAYRELGPEHGDEKAAEVAKRRALRTLEQLSYDVTLRSAEVVCSQRARGIFRGLGIVSTFNASLLEVPSKQHDF